MYTQMILEAPALLPTTREWRPAIYIINNNISA